MIKLLIADDQEMIRSSLQSFLVGSIFFSGRKDAAPANTEAKNIESHLCHQGNIFFVAMIEVNCLVAWIIVIFQKDGLCIFRNFVGIEKTAPWKADRTIFFYHRMKSRGIFRSIRFMIVGKNSSSSFSKTSFILKIGCSSSP